MLTGAVRGTPSGPFGRLPIGSSGRAPRRWWPSTRSVILVWNGGDFATAQPLDVPSAGRERAGIFATSGISAVAVSADGTRLGVAAADAVTDLGPDRSPPESGDAAGADSIAFSPDGTRLLVSRGWIQELPTSGSDPAPLPAAKCVPSWSARYTTDGKRIGVSLPWGFLLLAGPADASFAPILDEEQSYPAVAFSPDGLTVATSEPVLYRLSDGSRLWPGSQDPPGSDVCSDPPAAVPLYGAVAFSPDGQLLVARRGSSDAAGNPLEFRTSILSRQRRHSGARPRHRRRPGAGILAGRRLAGGRPHGDESRRHRHADDAR